MRKVVLCVFCLVTMVILGACNMATEEGTPSQASAPKVSEPLPNPPQALQNSSFVLTNGGSMVKWLGGQLTVTRPTVGSTTWLTTLPVMAKNNGVIVLQAYLDWSEGGTASDDSAGLSLVAGGPYLYDGATTASVSSRSTGANSQTFRLEVSDRNYGSPPYLLDQETFVTKGEDIKIVYKTQSNEIRSWYWAGSQWVPLGNPHYFPLSILGPCSPVVFYHASSTTNSVGTLTVSDVYFDSYLTDYSTHYPL